MAKKIYVKPFRNKFSSVRYRIAYLIPMNISIPKLKKEAKERFDIELEQIDKEIIRPHEYYKPHVGRYYYFDAKKVADLIAIEFKYNLKPFNKTENDNIIYFNRNNSTNS